MPRLKKVSERSRIRPASSRTALAWRTMAVRSGSTVPSSPSTGRPSLAPGLLQCGSRLTDSTYEVIGQQPGHHLSLADRAAQVDQQAVESPSDLETEGDLFFRREGSRDANRGCTS